MQSNIFTIYIFYLSTTKRLDLALNTWICRITIAKERQDYVSGLSALFFM